MNVNLDEPAKAISLKTKPLISIVVPCYNEDAVLPYLLEELVKLGDRLKSEFAVEFVLVDDGSKDSTWKQIACFAAQDTRVRGIQLSRNFGHQFALTCGCDYAKGAAVVSMDADLQDPPEVVIELVEKWRAGYDVVYAVRRQRDGESRFKLWSAAIFYRLIRGLGATQVRADTGDFRLMSRRSIDAFRQMREQHRFIRGMVGWVGFSTAEVFYHRKARRAGETKYPLRKMLRFAADAIVSFSRVPLKLSFMVALALFAIILGYLAIAVVMRLFFDKPFVSGWTSLILATIALGGINLVSIGILGEYVGRIYEQAKERPLYLVQETTQHPDSADGTIAGTQ